MVQVGEPVEHPGLAPPVGDVLQRVNQRSRTAGVGRQRRHDELEARLAVGVVDASELVVEDVAPAGHLAHREVERQRRVVGFGQRQPGTGSGCLPHAPQPREGRRVVSAYVAQRAEPRRLLAGRRRGVEPGSQQLLERAPRAPRARAAEEAPPRAAEVAEHAAA